MPKVPYNPVPQERVAQQGTPYLREEAPAAAFGANVGQAIEGFGKTLEGAGDELFKRAMAIQTLKNESEAREADANYIIKSGELHANYNSLTGKNAVDAYPQYAKDLQGLRKQMSEGLSNDASRRLFDAQTKTTMARTIFNGANHAATENRKYAAGASGARVEAYREQASQFPDDDTGFERGLRTVASEVRNTQAPLAGWSPEKVEQEVFKETSSMLSSRITGMARTDPFRATELLEKNRTRMAAADFEKVDRYVTGQRNTVGARNISADILAPLYEGDGSKMTKGLDQAVQEGRAKAERMFPEDKLFPTFVEQRIRADYTGRKRDIKDTQDEHRLNLYSAMNGDYTKGKMPTSVEELKASNPAAATAWDNLKPDQKPAVLRQLAQNAKGDYGETEENYRRYHQLKGMGASDNDKDRKEFLELDPMDEKMPRKWRTALIKQQQAIKSNSLADPRVNSAMRILVDSGIAPRPDQDKEGNFQFRGALQDQLDQFQTDHKRAPKLEEIKQIGAKLATGQSDPNRWDFGLFGKTPLYQMTVPKEILTKIKEDPRWKAQGIEPTDEQIRQEYIRLQYLKLYGKK